ncbi:MobH family relaxase [Serratia sp. Ag2]|uniref:MobH family relaxase n=1 Tax=Serratia sp. Ag2 TaxID=1532556 RepID=UPI000501ECBD|nr:MobH family relaxase [Serratia sp. Ag2]KFK95924.1 relaxase [Serratia sp. Ag2]
MLSLFRRHQAPSPKMTKPLPRDMLVPLPADRLLSTPRREKLLAHIWQRTAVSQPQFADLYLAPIERYASLVQQFPASEAHHHAYPGGMLDHGLEIIAYALKLRQSHLLPSGTSSEVQAAQSEAWSAAVAYAALLHDVGKIAVDLEVEQEDGSGWHPWHGPLQQPYRFRYREGREYRLHGAATGLLYMQVLDSRILDWLSQFPDLWPSLLYVLAGQYEHAGTLGDLVIKADQASVAQALGGDPARALAAPRHALQRKLLDGLRFLLKAEFKLNQPQASDGWLTQDALWLVSKTVSDKLRAHLLAQGISGIPESNTALFNVLQEHGIAQATPEGKAIWAANVTSNSGWSHRFTFLRLAPALIWESGERPAEFLGTVAIEQEANGSDNLDALSPESPAPASVSHTAVAAPEAFSDPLNDLLNMLPLPATPAPTEPVAVESVSPVSAVSMPVATEPVLSTSDGVSGAPFMTWLRASILSRKLIVNDARALIHTVDDTFYLVTPGLFQRYAQEHLRVGSWQQAQKEFELLHLHRKQPNGLNIWTCHVTGPRKSRLLYGYLLKNPACIINEILPNNPYLNIIIVPSQKEVL